MTKKFAVFIIIIALLLQGSVNKVKAEDVFCEVVFPGGENAAPGEKVAVKVIFAGDFFGGGYRPISWSLFFDHVVVEHGGTFPWWGGIETSIVIPQHENAEVEVLFFGGGKGCSKYLSIVNGAPQQNSTTVDPCGTPTGNSDFDACSSCMKASNTWTALGCVKTNNIASFIAWLLAWALGIGGGIALVISIFGGFQIITSAGNPEKVKAGKDLITAALSGLLFIAFSIFLLELIGVKIFHLPGFLK